MRTHYRHHTKSSCVRRGFLYSMLAALLFSIELGSYIMGDSITETLNTTGIIYFILSCLCHATVIALAAFLVFLPFALLGLRRTAYGILITLVSIMAMMIFLNMQVYKIYRFHINGLVLNMYLGPHANDIFDFSTMLYVKEALILLMVVADCIGLWFLSGFLLNKISRRGIIAFGLFLLTGVVGANGIHIWASFFRNPHVLLCNKLIPYYFPLSTSTLFEKMGYERPKNVDLSGMEGKGDFCYPLHPVRLEANKDSVPNVVLILIDAWSKRSLTEDNMPHLWKLAHEEQWYQDHVSCSNGTRQGVFGLFSSIQPYYYEAFEMSHANPVLMDVLQKRQYDFRTYPSASLESPPFHRILFSRWPHIRLNTPCSSAYERDMNIKNSFMADLPKLKQAGKPFFAFLFFDLLHAYSLPKQLLNRYQPSWEYGDFSKLNNDMDPTPFWNLYRNSAYQTDKMIGELIAQLKASGLYDNTIVLITGDHGQEYNENHKNFWGHSSNFSNYQIGVPLIAHLPNRENGLFQHRTTHYDIVPTLLHDYMGVENPIEDYSVGRLLSDTTPRLWHFVGNDLHYAFLLQGDTILTKEGSGWMEVTDAHLNRVEGYQIKPKEFEEVAKKLNRFFKK